MKKKIVTFRGYRVYVNRRGKTNLFLTFKEGDRRFEVTSGCSRREEALSEEVLRAKLLEGLRKWRKRRKVPQASTDSTDAARKLPGGSYGATVQKVASSPPVNGMPNGWISGMAWAENFVLQNQPPRVLVKPLGKVTYSEHYEVYNAFINSGLSVNTMRQYAHWLALLTAGLLWHGLDPSCGDIFANFDDAFQREAAGVACSYESIQDMLRELGTQPFAVQFTFWCEFSGAPGLADLIFVQHTDIDRDTGKVILARQGTLTAAQFLLLRDGLEVYRSRKCKKGAVYVMPEVVFSQEELARPDCNLRSVERTRQRVREAGLRMRRMLEEFLRQAGSPLTAQEFAAGMRKEFVAHLLSMAGRKIVIAQMLGVTLGALEPCNFPAEWELAAVRNIIEQHLADIRAGVQGRRLVTRTQVLEEFSKLLAGHLHTAANIVKPQSNEPLVSAGRGLQRIARGLPSRLKAQATEPEDEVGQALALAQRISTVVAAVNEQLDRELKEPDPNGLAQDSGAGSVIHSLS